MDFLKTYINNKKISVKIIGIRNFGKQINLMVISF